MQHEEGLSEIGMYHYYNVCAVRYSENTNCDLSICKFKVTFFSQNLIPVMLVSGNLPREEQIAMTTFSFCSSELKSYSIGMVTSSKKRSYASTHFREHQGLAEFHEREELMLPA